MQGHEGHPFRTGTCHRGGGVKAGMTQAHEGATQADTTQLANFPTSFPCS